MASKLRERAYDKLYSLDVGFDGREVLGEGADLLS